MSLQGILPAEADVVFTDLSVVISVAPRRALLREDLREALEVLTLFQLNYVDQF